MPEILTRKNTYKPGSCVVEGCKRAEERRGVCRGHRVALEAAELMDHFALPAQQGKKRQEVELAPLQVALPQKAPSALARKVVSAAPPARPGAAAPAATPTQPPPLEGLSDAQIAAMAREGLRVLGRTAAGGNFAEGEEGEEGEDSEEEEEALELRDEDVPGPVPDGADDCEAEMTKVFWESQQRILASLCGLYEKKPIRASRLLASFAEHSLEWATLFIVPGTQVDGKRPGPRLRAMGRRL